MNPETCNKEYIPNYSRESTWGLQLSNWGTGALPDSCSSQSKAPIVTQTAPHHGVDLASPSHNKHLTCSYYARVSGRHEEQNPSSPQMRVHNCCQDKPQENSLLTNNRRTWEILHDHIWFYPSPHGYITYSCSSHRLHTFMQSKLVVLLPLCCCLCVFPVLLSLCLRFS